MTPDQNQRLTRVGPGTPCGEMLRRYWWPTGFSAHVKTRPVPVRLLGEDLVLFRDGSGKTGLLARACPHRGAALTLGRVEEDGIRCCYHGWKFDAAGRCLETPAEPEDSPLKESSVSVPISRARLPASCSPTSGPDPAPEIPPYDLLVREDLNRVLYSKEEKCNWLQRAENGCDPHHLMALHAPGYPQIALKPGTITWEKTWYGFRQEQQYPESLYNVTHQIFPSHTRRLAARVGDDPKHYLNLRVPVDDVTTHTYFVQATISETGPYTIKTRDHTAYERMAYEPVEDGWWGIPSHEQDRIAQESQGEIADRTKEYLGTSDQGIAMFRRHLEDSIRAVEEGRDPIGVVRERGRNDVIRFDAGKNFSGGTNAPPAIIGA